MLSYHLYFFDPIGRIKAAAELECQSDDDARRSAQDEHDGRLMELWYGGRLVESYPARP
ncbi:hypothetical protein [Phenylobacterium sp.]|jgi:hypothetical protein|uniref:hypothetical protein n=1 Tax=Phenylobacterium sp. TaxID=1871053 RepID=UPI002E32658D|nr:hypothetical protein [Phenylobacterium sp.]HEX4710228.1 hypothetical protein [Phenylobacterium sp.]